MTISMKDILLVLLLLFSIAVKAQNDNLKLVKAGVYEQYQSAILQDKSGAYYVVSQNKKFGPYTSAQIVLPMNESFCVAQTSSEVHFIINGRVALSKKTKSEVQDVQFFPENKSFYFELINPEAEFFAEVPKKEYFAYSYTDATCTLIKTASFHENIEIMSISPNLDVVYNSHTRSGEDFNGPFYKNFKTNYSHENHFRAWIKSEDEFIPLWIQIEDGGQYDVQEVVYFGAKKIGAFNIVWNVVISPDQTNFAFTYGNVVYLKDREITGYKDISDLSFNENQELCFKFRKDNQWYNYIGGKETDAPKNFSPDFLYNSAKTDSVEFIEGEELMTVNYHGKELCTGKMYETVLERWSNYGGPVFVARDPKTNKVFFTWKGEKSPQYDRVFEFVENNVGNYAYAVKEGKDLWVYTEQKKYGPYHRFQSNTFDEQFLHIDDNNKVYYTIIEGNSFTHYCNGKKIETQNTMSQFVPIPGKEETYAIATYSGILPSSWDEGRSNFDGAFTEEYIWQTDHDMPFPKDLSMTLWFMGKARYQVPDFNWDAVGLIYKNQPAVLINKTLITPTETIEDVVLFDTQLIIWKNGQLITEPIIQLMEKTK